MEQVTLLKQHSLSYSDIYDKKSDEPAILIKNIPRKAATEHISYLLHLFNVRKKNDLQFQSRHLFQWMMRLEGQDQTHLLSFIYKNKNLVNDQNFVFISRRPCLDLLQSLLVFADSKNDRELNKNDFSILFRVLLLLNSKENVVQEKLFNWNDSDGFDVFADSIMTVQMRNLENERFKNYYLQFIKVYYFFIFCENDEKYASYLITFLKNLGLTNYKAYLWKLFKTYFDLLNSPQPTPKIIFEGDEVELQFYERMAINNQIMSVDEDYKYIRTYPLYKTNPNTFIFLDHRFFVDKFYWGCLFDFSSQVGISFAELKNNLGNIFSEQVLFYNIMEQCFFNYGDIKLNGTELKSRLSNSEPDFYIRKDNEVFLFEFKDFLIPANIKYANDPERIKTGILQKLEYNQNGQKKGIRQLLNCIRNIQNGVYTDKRVDIFSGEGATIYPVIVHTDICLESYGVNYFLNKKMRQIASNESVELQQVENLIVIHLDTLIQLQDHFKDGILLLADCFKAYLSYVSSGNPATGTMPFDEFVKYHLVQQHNGKLGPPKVLYHIVQDFASNTDSSLR